MMVTTLLALPLVLLLRKPKAAGGGEDAHAIME